MTKPTKQQVIEAYAGKLKDDCTVFPAGTCTGYTGAAAREYLADILVRAGLAEEPRPKLKPGNYWVKWRRDGAWEICELLDDGDDGLYWDGGGYWPEVVNPNVLTPPQE